MNGRAKISSATLATKNAMAIARISFHEASRTSAMGLEALGQVDFHSIETRPAPSDCEGLQRRDACELRRHLLGQRPPSVIEQDRVLPGMRSGIEPIVVLVDMGRKTDHVLVLERETEKRCCRVV